MKILSTERMGTGGIFLFFTFVSLLSLSESTSQFLKRKLLPKKDDGSDCPIGCVCHSKQMFCDRNNLRKLPRRYPEDVETIHYRENYVRKVRFVHLHGLYHLKHLMLKGNRVSYVEPKALIDLYHLVSLSLTENNLRFLSPDTFKSQSRMQVLSLRRNKLREIEELFWSLESLRLLNLAHNRIKEITAKTFRGNYQLRVLDLNDNNIRKINKYAFKQLPFLRFLVLRDNPLKKVALDFRQNLHLELLDFTNCRLSEVVKGMPFSINDLRMSENNITRINRDDFRTIRKVRLMVFNDNKIDFIHPLAFAKLWQLYALYLGANRLSVMPPNLPKTVSAIYANYNIISRVEAADLSHRPQLQTVFLKNNNISYIDQEAFRGLYSLENLDLRENKIEMMKPKMFQDTYLLQKLDLSSNPIKEMEHDCFKGLSNLNILGMSSVGNDSNIEPSIFKDTRTLKFLDLSNSSQLAKQMTGRPVSLKYIRSVEDLNLMFDDLDTLPKEFPRHFPRMKAVKLVGNPWHCDHKLLWMRDWMRNQSVEFFSPDEMICDSPPHLRGVKIRDLTENDAPAPWTPTIDQPVINLVNISFNQSIKGNSYQKVFLGQDGKWYMYNRLHKGEKVLIEKGDEGFNGVLDKVPFNERPGPPYVVVKPVKSYDAGRQRKLRGEGRRRGRGRKRGKQVAALNALIPDPLTQAAPPKSPDNNPAQIEVNPTWRPAPPLRTPSPAHEGKHITANTEQSPRTTDIEKRPGPRTVLPEQTVFHHLDKEEQTYVDRLGGSPLYDDSSGFVSGDEFLDV